MSESKAKTTTAKKAETVTVKVLGPVDHDGARYDAGDTIDMAAAAAEALVAAGVVERA